MKKKKPVLKKFDSFIEGDGDLRKKIFKKPPASQQVIFDLFSQLDHVYYEFFLFYSSVPSSSFWNIILSQVAAIASGSARNRNFCEDYDLLRPVKEVKGNYPLMRDKVVDLVGPSHALWWELSDPEYEVRPNTRDIWLAFFDLNPTKMVWEWWFEERARGLTKLWEKHKKDLKNPEVQEIFKRFCHKELGLLNASEHWFCVTQRIIEAHRLATLLKHRIANPYLRLAYTITKAVAAYNQPEQFFDTVNIAGAGLMRAIAKYAPSMAMAFSNFADREIRYEVYYQIANYNIIALPHKSWQKYREFEAFKKSYFEKYMQDASLDDLINEYKLDRREVYEIYRQVGMQNPYSLDQKVFSEEKSGNQISLKDRIEDPRCQEAQQLQEDQEVLLAALLRMSLLDRKVFVAAHNLVDVVQEIRPDENELQRFFFGVSKAAHRPPFQDL